MPAVNHLLAKTRQEDLRLQHLCVSIRSRGEFLYKRLERFLNVGRKVNL